MPLHQGGDGYDLDNLRTHLPVECHVKITAEGNRRKPSPAEQSWLDAW